MKKFISILTVFAMLICSSISICSFAQEASAESKKSPVISNKTIVDAAEVAVMAVITVGVGSYVCKTQRALGIEIGSEEGLKVGSKEGLKEGFENGQNSKFDLLDWCWNKAIVAYDWVKSWS